MEEEVAAIYKVMQELKPLNSTKNLDAEAIQALAIDIIKIRELRNIKTLIESAIAEKEEN